MNSKTASTIDAMMSAMASVLRAGFRSPPNKSLISRKVVTDDAIGSLSTVELLLVVVVL